MSRRNMTAEEIMADFLVFEKHLTETYNEAANESTGDDFRSDMMGILQEEHQLQSAIFHHMNRKGFYKVKTAKQDDISDALKRNQK